MESYPQNSFYKNFLNSLNGEEKKKLIEKIKEEKEEDYYREALRVFRMPSSPSKKIGKINKAGIPLLLIK